MSLATRLGMKSAAAGRRAREANVAEIKAKIQESNQTVKLFDGREVKCVDAASVAGYRWTGSGLVFYGGKVIERIDYD